jgi:protein arginine kinase activator
MEERPLECGECKKPIQIHYTEIVGGEIRRSIMCESCPVLQKKLHGSGKPNLRADGRQTASGISCGNCSTTLEDVLTGHPLGCAECYEVFNETLTSEMLAAGRIYKQSSESKTSRLIHVGQAPGQPQEISPSMQVLGLNEALNESLQTEDYEQAALLRDKIKRIQGGDDAEKEE